MSANEHVSKYQFYRADRQRARYSMSDYEVHKGDYKVAEMGVLSFGESEHEVSALYADEQHRHVVPTLLGIAHNAAQAAGTKLIPSNALSPYSGALVKGLKQRGLVTDHREDEATNTADFGSSKAQWSGGEGNGRRLDTTEVNEGRQTIRQAIKGRPKRR